MLDSQPVVTPELISFWKWIADYYICSPGEVMTAAMPAGMKLASESIITINPDDDGNATLSEREQRVKDMLATDGKMSVSVLESKTGCKNIMSTVRSLYDKGVVRVNEVVASKYKARQETRVELAKEYLSKGAWSTIMFLYQEKNAKTGEFGEPKVSVRRYQKQQGVLKQRSKFNISSKEQAKAMIAILNKWYEL